MDRDKKITLSLFLTWVVFGLFNLFGQPQAFVPPIMMDGLMVAGLGLYFCFPYRKNYFYPALITYTVNILLLSAMEIGWLENSLINLIIIVCIFILTIVYLSIGAFSLFQRYRKIAYILFLVIFFHSVNIILAVFYQIDTGKYFEFIIYSFTGLCTIVSLYLISTIDTETETLKRFYLLFLLGYLFDIGNYLALLQFTAN